MRPEARLFPLHLLVLMYLSLSPFLPHLMLDAPAESTPHVAAGAVGSPAATGGAGAAAAAAGTFYAAHEVAFHAPIAFPRHEACVEIEVDLRAGDAGMVVLGSDLTHEYVATNADYRS